MKPIDPLTALQAFCDRHKTQTAAAKALGVSLPYFNDMINMRRDISPRILEKLGLKRVVVRDQGAA